MNSRVALGAFLVALVAQRVTELVISARHARALAGRHPREFGRGHFPLFVALHTLYPLALMLEALRRDVAPPAAWPAWLAVWLASQALRVWAIRSLGVFWNVHIRVVPGAHPIRRGPYRFLPHPNYLAVAAELLAGPLMFGAWRTAIAFSVFNAVAMSIRIPEESRALQWAESQPESR